MAITSTTLSAAIDANQTQFSIASTSGVNSFSLGVQTFLKVDDEVMGVISVPVSGVVQVVRGIWGTQSVAHVASTPVFHGTATDFPNFIPVQAADSPQLPYNWAPVGPPLTGATIAPSNGYIHHFTGTTALVTITVPSGLVAGGHITLIFDGSGSGLTWTAAGNIAVAGTSTTAASAVTFFYDTSSAKWHPSRLA